MTCPLCRAPARALHASPTGGPWVCADCAIDAWRQLRATRTALERAAEERARGTWW